jgi:chemotaxis protein CheD
MGSTGGELTVNVGIGEMKVTRPPGTMTALGIGSCVVVVVRDKLCGAAGMAHIMLPWVPKRVREGANLFKYADYALDRMVERILESGGSRRHLVSKLVGGAHMFDLNRSTFPLNIGMRNLDAVRRKLQQLDIPLLAEEAGGSQGRSLELRLEDGSVRVWSVRHEARVI